MAYAVVRGVLGDRDDVEDVVQEVFIKVFRGLGRFRGDAQLSSWIYRIARNEAINATKRTRISGQPIEEIELADSADVRPDERYHQAEAQQELEGYLAQLEEDYRVVLELRYLGEKSYAEISEITELPIGTVKSYIHRAKIQLKRVMSHRTADGERRDLQKP